MRDNNRYSQRKHLALFSKTASSAADVGFEVFDDVFLFFHDVTDDIANGDHPDQFISVDDRQVADPLVGHGSLYFDRLSTKAARASAPTPARVSS